MSALGADIFFVADGELIIDVKDAYNVVYTLYIYICNSGAVLALARWGPMGGPQFQLEGPGGTICS